MRMTAAYVWYFISLIFPLLALYGAIVIQIRRDRRVLTRHFRVLAYALAGVFIMSFGPLLEESMWLMVNHGLALAWKHVAEVLIEDCLCVIRRGVEFAFMPGILAAVVASQGQTLKEKLVKASVTAIAAFVASDVYGQIQSARGPVAFLFSLFSNVVGGALAATLMVVVNHWIFEMLDKASETSHERRQDIVKWLKVSGILFFMTLAILSTTYFVFVHQLPGYIDVTLEDWERIGLKYSLRPIADPDFQDPIIIPLTMEAAHSFVKSNQLVVRVGSKASVGTASLSIETIPTGKGESIWKGRALRKGDAVFNKRIALGEITIRGGDLNPYVATPHGVIRAWLYVPRGQQVVISKARDELGLFDYAKLAKGATPVEGALSVRGRGIHLRAAAKSGFVLLPNVPVDVARSRASSWEIRVPNETQPIKIEATESRCCRGPAIRMLVAAEHELEITMESTEHIEFLAASLTNLGEGLSAQIDELRVSNPTGKLTVGRESRTVAGTGEIHFSGERLRLRRLDDGTIRAFGESRLIVVNSETLSKSVWSSVPVEIRAVILAALFGGIGWSFRRRRQGPKV